MQYTRTVVIDESLFDEIVKRGYASADEALRDLLSQTRRHAFAEYNGIPVLAFQSDFGNVWFGWAPGHATFSCIAGSYSEAIDETISLVEELLRVRQLSALEQRQAAAVSRGLTAMTRLQGKTGVVTLGEAFVSVFEPQPKQKQLVDACYLLACKVALLSEEASEATLAWAEQNLLKYVVCTEPIEQLLRTNILRCNSNGQ